MREFSVIDAAISVDQLRMRLKDNELEQYGEAFIPDFVYDVIRRLPRFSTMRVSLVHRVPCHRLIFASGGINKTRKNSWDFYWKNCMTSAVEL